jgi:hypothetical protein
VAIQEAEFLAIQEVAYRGTLAYRAILGLAFLGIAEAEFLDIVEAVLAATLAFQATLALA